MNRDWMPTVAGILDIVAGAGCVVGGLVLAVLGIVFVSLPPEAFDGGGDPPPAWVALLLLAFAVWLLVIAVVALTGGVYTLRRMRWRWALAGAVAAILASPWLGVPALILTVLAESEIRSGTPVEVPVAASTGD